MGKFTFSFVKIRHFGVDKSYLENKILEDENICMEVLVAN